MRLDPLNDGRPAEAADFAPGWSEVTRRLGLDGLFQDFAGEAAARDSERRLIFAEVETLKARRFGALRLPAEQGGAGLGLPELFALARDLARADPNIAHVFRNHFFAVEQHLASAPEPLSARILQLAGEGRLLGVAFSEATGAPAGAPPGTPAATLAWSDADRAFRLSGRKIYSTGNIYADHLLTSAVNGRTGEVTQVFLDTARPGVVLDDDWDGFGQKLTGSGSTVFREVPVRAEDLVPPPARRADRPWGYTFHQIYLTTVIAGIVDRVFIDALDHVRGRRRNFYHALAERPAAEPELQSVIGRIAAYRAAIGALAERAALALDAAWRQEDAAEASRLSLAATIAAAEAKVVTDEIAPILAGNIFDVASGSGVSAAQALDRHWRNIRVIAAHNPRVYKERFLGDHYLNGALPPTGAFF